MPDIGKSLPYKLNVILPYFEIHCDGFSGGIQSPILISFL